MTQRNTSRTQTFLLLAGACLIPSVSWAQPGEGLPLDIQVPRPGGEQAREDGPGESETRLRGKNADVKKTSNAAADMRTVEVSPQPRGKSRRGIRGALERSEDGLALLSPSVWARVNTDRIRLESLKRVVKERIAGKEHRWTSRRWSAALRELEKSHALVEEFLVAQARGKRFDNNAHEARVEVETRRDLMWRRISRRNWWRLGTHTLRLDQANLMLEAMMLLSR